MKVIWDKEKNDRLFAQRGLQFQPFADMITRDEFLDLIENPARANQMLFILRHKGYTHVVPCVIDKNGSAVLKTVYPSRKFHKIYGNDQTEER